jgi:hypothetical protein
VPEAPKPAAAKPAFKVTRSPFAPKLGGIGGPAGPAPISIGSGSALAAVSASTPTAGRPPKAAAPARPVVTDSGKPSVVGFVVDVVAAAVAVSFAIMFALNYFSA